MENLKERLLKNHLRRSNLPSHVLIENFANQLIGFLFPCHSNEKIINKNLLDLKHLQLDDILTNILEPLKSETNFDLDLVKPLFFSRLSIVYDLLLLDAKAIENGDPAARNEEEIIRSYPGFYAIAIYRVAHELFQLKVPSVPRILTEYAHCKTGIDIHPGATIGESFFIDHGTGVVIGETAIIGKNVKIYQGVTLGALSVKKELADSKRHPTIEDHVVIYAGATILGGRTIIGKNSTIGGNVWLTQSVKPNSLVYQNVDITIDEKKG